MTSDPTPRTSSALIALVPALVGGAVGYLLRLADVGELSEVAGALAATLVTGAPLYQRSLARDEQRAAMQPTQATGSGMPRPPSTPVEAGRATIALTVVLGAASFWLIDIITSMFGFGSLGFLGEQVPYTPEEMYFSASVRATPPLLVGVFLVAVWLGHRLRDYAGPALTKATGLYVAAVLLTNVAFAGIAQRSLTPYDVILPVATGAFVWVTVILACKYARRTQSRFDAMRAAGRSSSV